MNVGSKIGKLVTTARAARVARKFCGSLSICGLAIFLCFAATNFYDSANFVILAGNYFFVILRKYPVRSALIIFSVLLNMCNTCYPSLCKSSNSSYIVYRFVSEWMRQVVIEQTRFLSTFFV